MHWERIVVASVMALTAASAARCGGSVGTDPDRAGDASTGSDGPDALAAPTTGDATPNEADVRPIDAATSDDVQDGSSIDAIEAARDALEGAADAGADAATPCEADVFRCSGRWTEQCSDAGVWAKFGVVACYYGCYGAGICSGATCPSSCASDDDCASCPQSGMGATGSYPFCCDRARGVCNSVSVGCSGSTDAGSG
jgi:hypothetical protein